jgi:hypothetical protein
MYGAVTFFFSLLQLRLAVGLISVVETLAVDDVSLPAGAGVDLAAAVGAYKVNVVVCVHSNRPFNMSKTLNSQTLVQYSLPSVFLIFT